MNEKKNYKCLKCDKEFVHKVCLNIQRIVVNFN